MKMPQENSYSSFGGFWGEGTSNTNQAYKYNGKELDRMHGLDWYDYGTRNYDAALPVWTTVDPLAEKYYYNSPYAYCANNPISNIDPDGREPITLTVITFKIAIGAGIGASAEVGAVAVPGVTTVAKTATIATAVTADATRVVRPDLFLIK
jgi:RHS repeat-associated protein